MQYGITLIILGVLAAPSLFLANRPNAKEFLDKVVPYQGWAGLLFCLWGTWSVINAILNISLLGKFPIWWVTWVASSAVEAILGFILGYGMISKLLLSKNEEAKKRGEQLLQKLAPIQGKLGMAGIVIGVWVIIASILFR